MSRNQILLASTDAIAPRAGELFTQVDDSLDVLVVSDGAQCLHHYIRLSKEATKPAIVIIDYVLPKISGGHLASSIRGMERGLGLPGAAIILRCQADESDAVAAVIPELGRAVQLTRREEYNEEQQLKRLVKASVKVLKQLKGRSRR